MHTLDEVQNAIRGLSRDQKRMQTDWVRNLIPQELRVEEPALAYRPRRDEATHPADVSSVTPDLMSIDQYLKFIQGSPIRYEYIGGRVYAMSGESFRHNEIVTNLAASLKAHLRGGTCRMFHSGVLVKFTADEEDILYCPDVMVLCGPRDLAGNLGSDPRLVIEVLSPSTERIDRREKAAAYRQIAAMQEYVLIAQHAPYVTICRRTEEWQPSIHTDLNAVAEFQSIQLSVPLRTIYDGLFE